MIFSFLLFSLMQIQMLVATKLCRNVPTDQMVPIQYTSNVTNKPMEVHIANGTTIYNGHYNKILIGYTGNQQNGGNLPKNQCVAIKIYGNASAQHFKNSTKILTKLNKIDTGNEHFVTMMDFGVIRPNQHLSGSLSILELGKMDLNKELASRTEPFSKEELNNKIKSIMRILVDLHKVGMHLDLKPSNFVLVERQNDNNTGTKLIDFDGCILFSDPQHRKGTAQSVDYTVFYAAPELLIEHAKDDGAIEVTPKMDIWAAGITIFELLFAKRGMSKTHLAHIVELYRCAVVKAGEQMPNQLLRQLQLQKQSAPLPIGSPEWTSRYSEVVSIILDLWQDENGQMAEILLLLQNMLDIDPTKRMSAKGVLDYLDGNCRPPTMNSRSSKHLALIANVMGDYLRKVWEKSADKKKLGDLVMIKSSSRRRTTLDDLLRPVRTLDAAEQSGQKWLQQVAKRRAICEQ